MPAGRGWATATGRSTTPGVAEDRAEVLDIDDQSSPRADVRRLVATVDTHPLEPELAEQKYYAPGSDSSRGDVTGGTERVVLDARRAARTQGSCGRTWVGRLVVGPGRAAAPRRSPGAVGAAGDPGQLLRVPCWAGPAGGLRSAAGPGGYCCGGAAGSLPGERRRCWRPYCCRRRRAASCCGAGTAGCVGWRAAGSTAAGTGPGRRSRARGAGRAAEVQAGAGDRVVAAAEEQRVERGRRRAPPRSGARMNSQSWMIASRAGEQPDADRAGRVDRGAGRGDRGEVDHRERQADRQRAPCAGCSLRLVGHGQDHVARRSNGQQRSRAGRPPTRRSRCPRRRSRSGQSPVARVVARSRASRMHSRAADDRADELGADVEADLAATPSGRRGPRRPRRPG